MDWTEGEPNTFYTEASDLGLSPGAFPNAVYIKDQRIPFSHFDKDREGDLRAAIYVRRENGETVATATIFND